MKWKLVVFDLDGTLIDTIDDLAAAVNHALEGRGLPVHDSREYRLMVGDGVRNLVRRAMPEDLREDAHLHETLLSDFMAYYSSHIAVHSRPYPGIPGMLSELRRAGIGLAVASNKFQSGTRTLIGRFFPETGFESVLGGRDGVPLKPSPVILEEIMERAGVSRDETVMVGDSATDMRTAKAGGLAGVAVSWGFRPLEAKAEADYSVDDSGALLRLLLSGVLPRE